MKKILWADDEIDHLKPHIIFLQSKGYSVTTATNGSDAVELAKRDRFDAVILDEMMPGKDGLTTLLEIKEYDSSLKVIMITKSEEESIMEEAIGSKIDDYLIKPINPSQVYMSLKKTLDHKQITQDKISKSYFSELNALNMELMNGISDPEAWTDLYKKLSKYAEAFDRIDDDGIKLTLADLRKEANQQFCKFVEKNYEQWGNSSDRPDLSLDILSTHVLPLLKAKQNVVLFVFDCLRYDHWLVLESVLNEHFYSDETLYYSVLPTATQFARNSIFSGLFPDEFKQIVPNLWDNGLDVEGLNNHEEKLLEQNLKRHGYRESFNYQKCTNADDYARLEQQLPDYLKRQFSAFVVNFVDIITHSRSESKVLQEIIPNDEAYRKTVKSWFSSSPFARIFKKLAKENITVFITTDHGAIQCKHDVRIPADKDVTDNLRFKHGRSLTIDKKVGVTIKDPKRFRLPHLGLSSDYIIAKNDHYLIYPSNYNQYAKQYNGSYQHGGISMEEMIVPLIKLEPKK
jgi:CheY-like chemotaxis protein